MVEDFRGLAGASDSEAEVERFQCETWRARARQANAGLALGFRVGWSKLSFKHDARFTRDPKNP